MVLGCSVLSEARALLRDRGSLNPVEPSVSVSNSTPNTQSPKDMARFITA